MERKAILPREIIFDGRYVSLKYRIYLYNNIRNYEIKK
jgi:hypothetical protein